MIRDQSSLALFLFGAPRLERNGRLLPLNRRKLIALLSYLAVTNQAHTRDALATLFWPTSERQQAYGSLRRCLSLLKEAVSAEYLTISRQLISWQPTAPFWLDVAEFRRCLDAAKAHQHTTGALCLDCLDHLTHAADLYQGEFLAGFTLPDAPQFDDWQFQQAQALQQEYTWTLAQLVAYHVSRSQSEIALGYASRWVTADPLHEPAQQQLLQLYIATGQHAAGLRQYKQFTQMLQAELGQEPQPATTELYRQLRAATSLPSSFATTPLPTPLTPLMGQADALAQVVAWLGSGNGRLLTITGMGGVGKTRLALEVARLCEGQFVAGAVFVPLAQARSGAEALTAVAHATRCPLHADTPSGEQLHDHLRPRHLLLLLDNLEQLTGDVTWLERLLLAAPSIICLATSRIPLRLPGEWLFPLAPMPYPAADDDAQAATYAAVQFFAHCARRAQPHFSLTANLAAVARICRLVAGLPLALELVAIWTRSLPCAQIAAELAQGYTCLTRTAASCDDDGRQHSIHNTLAWSWSLLPPAAQTALAQLALIHGSFTLAIAPAITGADPLTLAVLVEHSLVQAGGDGRYHLHELTRHFAAARLAEQPEAAQQAGERHCAWYLAFLRQRAAVLAGGAQGDAVRELVGELDNVRAAWQWAAQNDRDAVAGAMQPLFLFYKIRGLFAEGAADFHLALVGGRAAGVLQTRLQVRLAFFYQQVDRLAEAWLLLQESLGLCQREGWVAETAVIHQTLGDMAWKRGASAAAATHYRASARACRQAGGHPGTANALSSLSNAVFDLGQTGAAAAYAQKSLRLRRQLGDWWGMAASLNNLSHIAEAQGNYAQATSLLQEGVTAAQHAGAAWLQGVLHRNLAHIQTLHVVGNGEW